MRDEIAIFAVFDNYLQSHWERVTNAERSVNPIKARAIKNAALSRGRSRPSVGARVSGEGAHVLGAFEGAGVGAVFPTHAAFKLLH
jgi:hypothetical protein